MNSKKFNLSNRCTNHVEILKELAVENENDDDFEGSSIDTSDDESSENDSENYSEDNSDRDESSDEIDKHIQESIQNTITMANSTQVANESSLIDKDCVSKKGMIWYKIKDGDFTKFRNRTQFNERVGITQYAATRINATCLSAFYCIMDTSMLDLICNHTNVEAELDNSNFRINHNDLLCFIGVLYCRGLLCHRIAVRDLWSKNYGMPIISKLMSRTKFATIMKYLRFDDKNTRAARKGDDKFAIMREIWTKFITNSQTCWTPGQILTVDEQLVPCKTRCPFIQYIPNKPDKFGIKFWILADQKSKYTIRAFPYCGKDDTFYNNTTDKLGQYIVKKLLEPYFDKGYHVTADNFFSNIELALFLKSKNTTYLGTVNKNKPDLPLIIMQKQKLNETLFLENDSSVLLTIHQGKINKKVLLISTLHDMAQIPTVVNPKLKPNTILTYNQTKCGVDTVDQMAKHNSVKSPTRRWPIQVWYNILNLSGINSWILYKNVNRNTKKSRREFLLELVEEIIIMAHGREEEVDSEQFPPIPVKKRKKSITGKKKSCKVRQCNNNKSIGKCSNCDKDVCGKCCGEYECLITCILCQQE
jgi:hypothetical protein